MGPRGGGGRRLPLLRSSDRQDLVLRSHKSLPKARALAVTLHCSVLQRVHPSHFQLNFPPNCCFVTKRAGSVHVMCQKSKARVLPGYSRVGSKPSERVLGSLVVPTSQQGGQTVMRKLHRICLLIAFICLATGVARAQSFRVQCPTSTITHPVAANNDSEPAYAGPTYTGTSGYPARPARVNGAIKCQQISGGDGFATMGDGTQTYMFSFGPLSGLAAIASGQAGTEPPSTFNTPFVATPSARLMPGDPATTDDPSGAGGSSIKLSAFTYNGAVGLVPDAD